MEDCAFPINADLKNRIKTEMEAMIDCKNNTWPNITGLEGDSCPFPIPSTAVTITVVGPILAVILAGFVGLAVVAV